MAKRTGSRQENVLLDEAKEHLFAQGGAANRVMLILAEERLKRRDTDPDFHFSAWIPEHCDGGEGMVCNGLVEVDGAGTIFMLHMNIEPRKLGRATLVLTTTDGAEVSNFVRRASGYFECEVGEMITDMQAEELAHKILREFVKHVRRMNRVLPGVVLAARGNGPILST